MDTGFSVMQELTHGTQLVASVSAPDSTRQDQYLLNFEYEIASMQARRTPVVPALSAANPTVILVDGPYDGQDIRVTESELSAGSFLRNGQRYLRVGAESPLGLAISVPTFKWVSGPLSVHARSVRARNAWAALKCPDRIDDLECGLAV